jgi:hypothetical protein
MFPFIIEKSRKESNQKEDRVLKKSNKTNSMPGPTKTNSHDNQSSSVLPVQTTIVTKTVPKISKAKSTVDVPIEIQQQLFSRLKDHRLTLVNPSLHLHAANIFSDTILWELVSINNLGNSCTHHKTGLHQGCQVHR